MHNPNVKQQELTQNMKTSGLGRTFRHKLIEHIFDHHAFIQSTNLVS